MRNFIINLIVFIFILLCCLTGLLLLNRYYAYIPVNNNKHILIIGHSHSECAYNDSLINGVKNFSKSGESYFYSYFKTKLLIEKNPNINTVLIEFSNNQIESSMDNWIWGEKHMSYRFPQYGSFMDYNSYSLLWHKNSKCFLNSLKFLTKHNIKNVLKKFKLKEDIGGYFYLERNKTDSLLRVISTMPQLKHKTIELSKYNIIYLKKTIEYLLDKKKKVFLIRSPMHNMYEGFRNEQQFQNVLKNNFPEVEFIDFSHFKLLNSEFGDLDHLNYKGAAKFSIWFNELLKKGLLIKKDKQRFIDSEINDIRV